MENYVLVNLKQGEIVCRCKMAKRTPVNEKKNNDKNIHQQKIFLKQTKQTNAKYYFQPQISNCSKCIKKKAKPINATAKL